MSELRMMIKVFGTPDARGELAEIDQLLEDGWMITIQKGRESGGMFVECSKLDGGMPKFHVAANEDWLDAAKQAAKKCKHEHA